MMVTAHHAMLVGICCVAALSGSRVTSSVHPIARTNGVDSAALVARALAIAKADANFGSLRVASFQREGDVTTITLRNPDPDALGGGIVVHINARTGNVCLEVFG